MIQEEIEQFKMLAPAILPELFDSVSIAETDIDEESATISYALSHQYDLEDVMDKFEDQMELTILYHFIPSAHTDFGHQCCAYSDTQFGHMFKMIPWMPCVQTSWKTLTVMRIEESSFIRFQKKTCW